MSVTRVLVLQSLEAESREQRHLQKVHGYVELDEVAGKDGVGIVQLGQVEKSADPQTQRRIKIEYNLLLNLLYIAHSDYQYSQLIENQV